MTLQVTVSDVISTSCLLTDLFIKSCPFSLSDLFQDSTVLLNQFQNLLIVRSTAKKKKKNSDHVAFQLNFNDHLAVQTQQSFLLECLYCLFLIQKKCIHCCCQQQRTVLRKASQFLQKLLNAIPAPQNTQAPKEIN